MPVTVIIGGGVIGLSTAYHLARKGHGHIIVLEKDTIGAGSSSRAAGITTGLLWSEPGVLARKIAIQQFRELSRELPGYRYHNEQGCLNLFSPELWPAREALLPLYDKLGAPYEILTSEEVRERWPTLQPPADHLGLLDPNGGYSEPPDYLIALRTRITELGVEIREGQKVTGFIHRGDSVTGVRTQNGTINADAVVVTVHAWSQTLLQKLNLSLPLKCFVHQRYLSHPLPAPLEIPAINADSYAGYIRPAFGNRLLLGTETAEREEWRVTSSDFQMTELSTPAEVRTNAIERFRTFAPVVTTVAWEAEQVGLISYSMDGEPVLGPVSQYPGLYLGASFHSGGFSYNPVAGLLLAELVNNEQTSVDISSFSPDRFDAADVQEYLTQTAAQQDAVRRRH